MYERQHGTGFEIGSYAHRAILMEADDIPSIEASALSPTMLPFTQEDFDPQLEDALELFPEIVGDESVGVKLAINGLLSLTPDGNPIIGETPEVKGLWSAAAIWIKEAPGIAKTIAEWMTNGEPEIDPHGSDIARFYDHHRTAGHIAARTTEGYNKTYGIVHPMEQWASNRPSACRPVNDRQHELGAEFFEAAGWERPFWYEANEPLLGEYGDRVMPRDGRVGIALVVADHQRRAPRDARPGRDGRPVGVRDLRRHRARARWATSQALVRQPGRRAGRPDRLHAAPQRRRRDPRRPDDHAARPRPLPGRDRRRHGHARQEVLRRPPAGRRLGPALRR